MISIDFASTYVNIRVVITQTNTQQLWDATALAWVAMPQDGTIPQACCQVPTRMRTAGPLAALWRWSTDLDRASLVGSSFLIYGATSAGVPTVLIDVVPVVTQQLV